MKYISYRRVSTQRQGESGLGLDSQWDQIKAFYPDIAKDFIEVESGKNVSNRPILEKAIQYCIKHEATLVVAKVDRLARNTEQGLAMMNRLQGRLKVIDLPSEVDKFTLTLYFAFAEREAELISIRTKAALKRAKENGVLLGASRAKGKVWSRRASLSGATTKKDMAKTNPNNVRARHVATLLRDQGKTYEYISTYLNDNGFTTPSGKGEWNSGTVRRLMVKSPIVTY